LVQESEEQKGIIPQNALFAMEIGAWLEGRQSLYTISFQNGITFHS